MNTTTKTIIPNRDYSKLEGKTITYYDGNDLVECIVVGIDPDIGITIKTTNKWTNNLNTVNPKWINTRNTEQVCINGPLSPNETTPEYEKTFNYVVTLIDRGYFSGSEYAYQEEKIRGYKCFFGNLNCAFGA